MTANQLTFDKAAEQAIFDAFDEGDDSTVVTVVEKASRAAPPSSVRKVYWRLVSDGKIETTSSGRITRVR